MNYQRVLANRLDVVDVVITEQSLRYYDEMIAEGCTERVRDAFTLRREQTLRDPGLGYWLA